MNKIDTHTPAAWQAADLKDDRSWVFQINDTARTHMLQAVKKAHVPDRPLFDYTEKILILIVSGQPSQKR